MTTTTTTTRSFWLVFYNRLQQQAVLLLLLMLLKYWTFFLCLFCLLSSQGDLYLAVRSFSFCYIAINVKKLMRSSPNDVFFATDGQTQIAGFQVNPVCLEG